MSVVVKLNVRIMDNIYIYEDEECSNFLPLVYLRPVFDLLCGIYTFRERIERLYPNANIYPISRFLSYQAIKQSEPKAHQPQAENKQTLFINGRAILYSPLPDKEGVFVAQDEVAGFKVKSEELKVKNLKVPITNKFLSILREEFKSIKVKATVVKYPWDLIKENGRMIIEDYKLCNSNKVTLSPPGVFLNETEGPICISKGVKLRPPTVIDGPCYIGDFALIDGAKIRPGTSIGKGCKIGGEVEGSIFSDYSNKHHEGFVGHSFVGEWVNLGALTTTSDLKNTYGTIKCKTRIDTDEDTDGHGKVEIDTGLMKLGSLIGDHAKTGIGTLLDTGSVIGCFANIYGGGIFPKYIPSFSWGTKDGFTTYELEKAIEVAKKVMTRRGKELTPEYEARVRNAFQLTNNER